MASFAVTLLDLPIYLILFAMTLFAGLLGLDLDAELRRTSNAAVTPPAQAARRRIASHHYGPGTLTSTNTP